MVDRIVYSIEPHGEDWIVGRILSLHTGNERRCCFATTPLIGWVKAYNQSWILYRTVIRIYQVLILHVVPCNRFNIKSVCLDIEILMMKIRSSQDHLFHIHDFSKTPSLYWDSPLVHTIPTGCLASKLTQFSRQIHYLKVCWPFDIFNYICNNQTTLFKVAHHITATSWWERCHLKSPASRMFVQPFVQAQIKEIEAPRYLPMTGGFPS